MKNSSSKSLITNIKKNSFKNINNSNIIDLTHSTSSYRNNKNPKNEKFQINCNCNKASKTSSIKQINCINNENEEELTIIQNLWDDLGITERYQDEFLKYIFSINNEQEISDIFYYEKNNLIKLRESLIKLSAEITNRDNNIFKLKQYNTILEQYFLEKKDKIDSIIFDKIQNIIKFLRLNTVNIINQIGKVREISSFYELKGKWNPDRANRAYLYKSDYILNMYKHINFINNSILFNFIETNNGIKKTDLFFSNVKYIITNDNTKLKIPISIELKNVINKCKYIILQDNLLNNIKRDNIFIKQRKILSSKTRSKNNILTKCQSDICLANDSDSKKFMTMFGHNKINLSRTLYYLKKTMGNNYEKMFISSNKKINKNFNFHKNMEIMDKYFNIKRPINMNDENNMNINNNFNNNKINIEHLNIKEEDKSNNIINRNINSKIIVEHINIESEEYKNKNNQLKENNDKFIILNYNENDENLKNKEDIINIKEKENNNEIKDNDLTKKEIKGYNNLSIEQIKNTEKSE